MMLQLSHIGSLSVTSSDQIPQPKSSVSSCKICSAHEEESLWVCTILGESIENYESGPLVGIFHNHYCSHFYGKYMCNLGQMP